MCQVGLVQSHHSAGRFRLPPPSSQLPASAGMSGPGGYAGSRGTSAHSFRGRPSDTLPAGRPSEVSSMGSFSASAWEGPPATSAPEPQRSESPQGRPPGELHLQPVSCSLLQVARGPIPEAPEWSWGRGVHQVRPTLQPVPHRWCLAAPPQSGAARIASVHACRQQSRQLRLAEGAPCSLAQSGSIGLLTLS